CRSFGEVGNGYDPHFFNSSFGFDGFGVRLVEPGEPGSESPSVVTDSAGTAGAQPKDAAANNSQQRNSYF
ncbi:MAG: hypothetical protein JWM99_1764, partial [Verrucomicrobiales bacterium]|nr:hypothetical protein [Verrucomicrobiales bacterium]